MVCSMTPVMLPRATLILAFSTESFRTRMSLPSLDDLSAGDFTNKSSLYGG